MPLIIPTSYANWGDEIKASEVAKALYSKNYTVVTETILLRSRWYKVYKWNNLLIRTIQQTNNI